MYIYLYIPTRFNVFARGEGAVVQVRRGQYYILLFCSTFSSRRHCRTTEAQYNIFIAPADQRICSLSMDVISVGTNHLTMRSRDTISFEKTRFRLYGYVLPFIIIIAKSYNY